MGISPEHVGRGKGGGGGIVRAFRWWLEGGGVGISSEHFGGGRGGGVGHRLSIVLNSMRTGIHSEPTLTGFGTRVRHALADARQASPATDCGREGSA